MRHYSLSLCSNQELVSVGHGFKPGNISLSSPLHSTDMMVTAHDLMNNHQSNSPLVKAQRGILGQKRDVCVHVYALWVGLVVGVVG